MKMEIKSRLVKYEAKLVSRKKRLVSQELCLEEYNGPGCDLKEHLIVKRIEKAEAQIELITEIIYDLEQLLI